MLTEWLNATQEYARRPAMFYSGNRKILRHQRITFEDQTPDISLRMIGFTKNKMSQLRRNYLHEESRDAAVQLWKGRLEKDKYGSVGFHCFRHYVKGRSLNAGELNVAPVSKRASVMGPCIQAISLTLGNDGKTHVDAFYRTTELFKKFPADLIFFPELLEPFDFTEAPVATVTCHFANMTCHPMYFASLLPLFADPVQPIEDLKQHDEYFWKWCVKWTARYVCEERAHGIAKYAQALRVKKDVLERLSPEGLPVLQQYLRKNHPGYAHTRFDEDGGEGEE